MQADASPGSLHCWEYQLPSALCSTVKGSDVEMDKRRPESEEGYDTQRAAVRKAAEREAGASRQVQVGLGIQGTSQEAPPSHPPWVTASLPPCSSSAGGKGLAEKRTPVAAEMKRR